MNLQLALLILGCLVIGLVFALSRYSDVVDEQQKKLVKLLTRLKRPSQNRPSRKRGHKAQRNSSTEPMLGDVASTTEDIDAPLFDFNSDSPHVEQNEEPNLDQAIPPHQQSLINEAPQSSAKVAENQAAPAVEEVEVEVEAQTKTKDEGPAPQEERITSLKPTPIGPFTSLRQIDYWIKLSPATPVTQGEIMNNLGDWKTIQSAIQIHALTQEEPHWVNLLEVDAVTVIVDVVASYQLLNSGRASTFETLCQFDQLVSELGEALRAEKLMMASPEQALEQSQRLEHFFEQSHGPLEVAVCAPQGEAFMGKLVETSAKQQGLDYFEGDYVRLKKMANESIILYRMRNNDAPHFVPDMSASGVIKSVRFSMTPSLSRTPGRDAKEMLDAVKAFASRVKGDIRIPGQTEFHQDQLLNLRNRVSKLEQEMINAGLEPGSPEIHRIFS